MNTIILLQTSWIRCEENEIGTRKILPNLFQLFYCWINLNFISECNWKLSSFNDIFNNEACLNVFFSYSSTFVRRCNILCLKTFELLKTEWRNIPLWKFWTGYISLFKPNRWNGKEKNFFFHLRNIFTKRRFTLYILGHWNQYLWEFFFQWNKRYIAWNFYIMKYIS